MAHTNIDGRRAAVAELLRSGTATPGRLRDVAAQFGCSYSSVHADLCLLRGVPVHRTPRRIAANQVNSENMRARKVGVPGTLQVADWLALCERYNNVCLCCGRSAPLAIDHVVPITRGGPNIIDNVQPLCSDCNSRKGQQVIDYRPDSEGLAMASDEILIRVRVEMYLRPELLEALDAEAARRGIARNKVLDEALRVWVVSREENQQ